MLILRGQDQRNYRLNKLCCQDGIESELLQCLYYNFNIYYISKKCNCCGLQATIMRVQAAGMAKLVQRCEEDSDAECKGQQGWTRSNLIPDILLPESQGYFSQPPLPNRSTADYRDPAARSRGDLRDLSFFNRCPGLVRVVRVNILGHLQRVRSEVLLENLALLVDDKRHYSRLAPV